ncbi:hypothetical protein A0H81_06908 [Grifola frondosa]|uniref:F-box domain-containing protein n=1 Tax=Grifola frondosa TaxID=5627 RepID=A0A1C7M8Q6_GRIFR|nr:hypothetical protein A0H81_06908 [Grifola frondosa]
MDIFLEIAARLHPLDVLHFARVSKWFRSILMSKRHKFIWSSALKGVPGLPECPSSMSEPYYAALLFDRTCFACGVGRSNNVDHAIGVRFCSACYKDNVRRITDLMFDMPDVLCELSILLLPCETTDDISRARLKVMPAHHGEWDRYYVAEFRAIIERVWELQPNNAALKAWVYERADYVIERQEHAVAVLEWEQKIKNEKQDEEMRTKDSRKASIEKKLVELGYGQEDFPTTFAWSTIMDQPRELTTRIWNNIRPKLEAEIQQFREERTQAAFEARLEQRRSEVIGYYDQYLLDAVAEEDRATMPNAYDACRLPSLSALTLRDEAYSEVSKDNFDAVVDDMLAEAQAFKIEVQRELVRMLLARKKKVKIETVKNEEAGNDVIDNEVVEDAAAEDGAVKDETSSGVSLAHSSLLDESQLQEILRRPTSLFICMDCRHPTPFGYPAIHEHWRRVHEHQHFNDNDPSIFAETEADEIILRIFDAAGLPADISQTSLDDLVKSGRLVCLCGSPALPPPAESSWASLVGHFVNENTWYEDMRSRRKPNTDHVVMINNHDLTDSIPRIKLLPPGEHLPTVDYGSQLSEQTLTDMTESLTGFKKDPYCCVCGSFAPSPTWWRPGSLQYMPATVEGIAHHMQTKHNKVAEQTDVLYLYYSGLQE